MEWRPRILTLVERSPALLSDTLDKGLRRYAIGDKLRSLRLRKAMGLVQLAAHTGLSPAMLSKLERGQVFPTLPTLLRISLVFNVGLDHFFSDSDRRRAIAVSRAAGRVRLHEPPGARDAGWSFEALDHAAVDKKLSAWLAEFHPVKAGTSPTHHHPGIEFLFVVSGRLMLSIKDEEPLTLDPGDAVYFDGTRPHGYRRVGSAACRAVVITVP